MFFSVMSDKNRDHFLVGLGSCIDNTLQKEYWEKRWEIDYIIWHQSTGNERMQRVLDRVLKEELAGKEPSDIKVLLPLCGKTNDMYQMYKRGFTVVGIDWATQPINDFFKENNIETDPSSSSSFIKSKDGRLIIGIGDWFSFGTTAESEKRFPFDKYDVIWDRGCFDSINVNLREKFAAKIVPLLAPTGVLIQDAKIYELKGYKGPPLPLTESDLQKYYGSHLSVEMRDHGEWIDDHASHDTGSHWKARDIKSMQQYVYVLKHKK